MSVSADNIASDLGSSPWHSQVNEHDYHLDVVEGAIPEALRGVLYRIGPGRFEIGPHPIGHIFDGDGMISRFQIDDDGIGYRNRYVRTAAYKKANESGELLKGFGTMRAGGRLANALRFPENYANTNVLLHNTKLYALWEGGRPHRLNPETLATEGVDSLGGALKRLGAFSAHPKSDPATGEVFNFGLDFYPRPVLRCYRLGPDGSTRSVATVPIPQLGFIHDFALTQQHLVFVLGPLVVRNPLPFLAGSARFDETLEYRPELGTTIVLVPRDGGKQIRLETDSLFHFHVTNAYESGNNTVVEVVAHDPGRGWDEWGAYLRDYSGNPGPAFGGKLQRLVIDRDSRTVSHEQISDVGCEFPQLDYRRSTQEHRFTYLAEASQPAGNPDSVTTIDHTNGSRSTYLCSGDNTVCEPLFAPDPSSENEGDGWLLTVEHRPETRTSRMLILDAHRPGDGPVAAAEMSHHIPMTFHGTYSARS